MDGLAVYRASRIMVRMAANWGLGVALAIAAAVGCGWMAVRVMDDGKARELKYQEIVQSDLRQNTQAMLQVNLSLLEHDRRAQAFIDSRRSMETDLQDALREATDLLRKLNAKFK